MGISTRTHKMLWGRAANRCSFTGCQKELVVDATDTDDESLIGENCHIVARQESGPRGVSSLSTEQRDKYDNLILLCNVHHKVIDDQPGEYTVEKLKQMKTDHEGYIREKLTAEDSKKQSEDERYASYIDQFERNANIENWNAWTSYLLQDCQPQISKTTKDSLDELRKWLLNRIWPGRYPSLEASFENFRSILCDLMNTFDEYSEPFGDDAYITEKFYRRVDHLNQKLRREQVEAYEYHCYLIQDLTLELTRAANYIFDQVREYVSSSYRLSEGTLLVTAGMFEDCTYKTFRTEYCVSDSAFCFYLGLEKFRDEQRFERDFALGKK